MQDKIIKIKNSHNEEETAFIVNGTFTLTIEDHTEEKENQLVKEDDYVKMNIATFVILLFLFGAFMSTLTYFMFKN